MVIKYLVKFYIIFLIFLFIFAANASPQINTYTDDFSNLDLSKWTPIPSTTWQVNNGTLSGTGISPDLIFNPFSGTQYISEVNLTANRTGTHDYASVAFYFYYEDSDNFGRVLVSDDNQGPDNYDRIFSQYKGVTFSPTDSNLISGNRSIELDSKSMHHLKVVRLNKNIYIIYEKRLVLTSQIQEEKNPSGKVGFTLYDSTGYFDNFYLRPISMNNASGYVNELNLTSANPTTRLGAYTLRLEDIESSSAMFSLSKFGKTVDSTIASEGDTASLNFENGEEGVEFKVTKAFNGSSSGRVELEDVIYASSESLVPDIANLTLLPAYYQDANMTVNFSITNPGSIKYNGTSTLTISSEGSTATLNPELDLGANQSKNFTVGLVAAKSPGVHKLTISMKLDEYTTVTKSLDYQVRALNPVITTLSPDLREEGGIRGSVTIGSAFPDELVDWNTTANLEVFRVLENGKQRVYTKQIPVMSKTFDVSIPYSEFYQDDGRYLVTLQAGEMVSDKFFEIKGPDGEYRPAKSEIIPPTIISNSSYPQLMLLLIGMVAALSVRNHMRPRNWSLPIDLVAVGCGAALFASGMWQKDTEITSKGMIMAGVGFGLLLAREHDSRIESLLMRGSPIHDFTGLVLIFLSAFYLVLLVPQWSGILIMGTLIVYYTLINLHGERK